MEVSSLMLNSRFSRRGFWVKERVRIPLSALIGRRMELSPAVSEVACCEIVLVRVNRLRKENALFTSFVGDSMLVGFDSIGDEEPCSFLFKELLLVSEDLGDFVVRRGVILK
jgi:hypothetical protein